VSWQEQRRLNDAARAEQARQDALTAAQVENLRARTQTETNQAHAAQQAELARQRRVDRRQERDDAKDRVKDRRQARWVALRVWVSAHTVDLLIYPLAVVSAVMAVPAMAGFGHDVYGNAAGYALPVITELGMWAFAFAVHLARHRSDRDGQDRPVWALQLGVWSFAAVAAGLNFLHGLAWRDVASGAVMAVASVAGVMAHQLVTAAPRRGRVERDTARVERQAAAKAARVRRAAVRAAVAEIGQDGAARLLFQPGLYRLTRSRRAGRIGLGRRTRLESTALPGLPVTPALDDDWDDMDRALAAMLATVDPYPGPGRGQASPDPTSTTGGGGVGGGGVGGGVGTLDRDPDDSSRDQRESTPIDRPSKQARSTRKPTPARATTSAQKSSRAARSIEGLRTQLHRLVEADPASIDPTSAESIRRALRCSAARARELRDTYRPTTGPTD
jgi:hypothetical protein